MHFEFEYYEGKRDSWCVARQKRLLPRKWFPQKGRQQSPDYGAPSGAFAFSAPGRLRLDPLQGEFDKTYELDLAPARQRFIWIKTVGALNRQQDISLEICCVSGVNVDILPAFQIEEHPILEDLPVGGDGFDGDEVVIASEETRFNWQITDDRRQEPRQGVSLAAERSLLPIIRVEVGRIVILN